MDDDKLKNAIAESTAEAFRVQYPQFAKGEFAGMFDAEFILGAFEKPKDPEHGPFSLPVFRYAKVLRMNPSEIAAGVAPATLSQLQQAGVPNVTPTAAGGYINYLLDALDRTTSTLRKVLKAGSQYGDSDEGSGKRCLVEYSSPNIAKPFGIGHLRSTIIGSALRRIYRKLGYEAVGINYLGDWGTQFGKMIVAYRRWGTGIELKRDSLKALVDLYVRFHEEAEKDPGLEDQAREAFRKLEEGASEEFALWQKLKEISLEEYARVYDVLGVEFDWVTGEAFMNDKMTPLIERLQLDGLTSESQGALVVDLRDPQLPPCLLRKADGATLYATRDLAGLVYRWEKYRFAESLYVVGMAQSDYFRQILKVIELMEQAEGVPESERISGRDKHIDFGWVRFEDQTLSTRKGNIIYLEDVYARAAELARDKIREKNPELARIDEVALRIGVGAVIFGQLSVRRQKDVNLIWEDILNFEGETGPYLQYTHARLCSLMRNFGGQASVDVDYTLLDGEEELRVVELLADFPAVVADAGRIYEPQLIAAYLIRLTGAFNKFYQRKVPETGRIDKIISDNAALTAARMTLVRSVQTVVAEGLRLLGMYAPEEM